MVQPKIPYLKYYEHITLDIISKMTSYSIFKTFRNLDTIYNFELIIKYNGASYSKSQTY